MDKEVSLMFCSHCGSELPAGAASCPSCGAVPEQPVQQVNYEQQTQYSYDNNPQPYPNPSEPQVYDSGSIGWGILGFLIPLAGLILFLVWKNSKPRCAKVAGIGALISFCLALVNIIF